ncbi:MAG: flagellar hook-length control protein FliK [Caloramator sp.]|nr:flagellar hook-length control protein FliK [Caloramator sp.]
MKVEVVKIKNTKLEVINKNAAKGDEFEKILGAATNNLELSQGKNIDTEGSKANIKLNEKSNDKKEELMEITDEVMNINPNVQLLLNQIFNFEGISVKQNTAIYDIHMLISVENDISQPAAQGELINQENFNLAHLDNEGKVKAETQELPNNMLGDEIKETIADVTELLSKDEKNSIKLSEEEPIKQNIDLVEVGKDSEKINTVKEENIDIEMASAKLDIKKEDNTLNVDLTEGKKVKEKLAPIYDNKEYDAQEVGVKAYDEDETEIKGVDPQGKETNVQTKELTVKHLKDEIQRIIPQAKAEEIVNITVEKFKSIRLPDITEVKVKLKPEDLGEITVKVVLEKGEIKGNIIVEKREVALVLQNNIENMKQELKQNNVNLSNISVYLSNDGFNENAGRNFKDFSRGNRQQNVNIDFEEENFEEELEGINLYA